MDRRRASPTLAAVLAVVGFLLVTAFTSTTANRKAEAPRKAELVRLIEQRRDRVADLDRDVRRLRTELTGAQQRVARLSKLDHDQAERLAELAAQAGTTALRGSGLSVQLSDSDRKPGSNEDAGAYRIHDNDIQLVVNALYASGAEAVAVNDSRIVATTAIRAAGDTIVVNFRPLTPPYVVRAIGADAAQFRESAIAKRFDRWTRVFGLGFTVRRDRDVTVPPYTGRVGIVTAVPAAGEGGP
jgi:uncharacterized protein YlxW (UPF0749 family)